MCQILKKIPLLMLKTAEQRLAKKNFRCAAIRGGGLAPPKTPPPRPVSSKNSGEQIFRYNIYTPGEPVRDLGIFSKEKLVTLN